MYMYCHFQSFVKDSNCRDYMHIDSFLRIWKRGTYVVDQRWLVCCSKAWPELYFGSYIRYSSFTGRKSTDKKRTCAGKDFEYPANQSCICDTCCQWGLAEIKNNSQKHACWLERVYRGWYSPLANYTNVVYVIEFIKSIVIY